MSTPYPHEQYDWTKTLLKFVKFFAAGFISVLATAAYLYLSNEAAMRAAAEAAGIPAWAVGAIVSGALALAAAIDNWRKNHNK